MHVTRWTSDASDVVSGSPPAAPLVPSDPGRPTHADSSLRVLWIDDDLRPDTSDVSLLESAGCRVECATDGERAEALGRGRPFDAILVDLRLKEESGLDVMWRLRQSGVTAPMVMLTGFAGIDSAVAAMKLGAADYLVKPCELDDLVRALRRAVGERHRRPTGPPLDAHAWLDARREELSSCVIRRQAIEIALGVLADRRLTLRWYFGCADALRVAVIERDLPMVSLVRRMQSLMSASAGPREPGHPRVRQALDTLERQGIKLSQEMFAGRVGLSRAYLSHLLAAQTGRKASDWCRCALMRTALRAILESGEQIAQVAYAAGYQHAGQFNRDFVRMFGAPPTELRRIYRASAQASL